MTASSEPTGRRFTKISAPEDLRTSTTASESSTGSIISSTNLPIPSKTLPGLTSTFNLGTSENLVVLFGSVNIASEISNPTLFLFISKAATISISDTRYPPITSEISPFSVSLTL